jgi:hypothetical protein
MRGIRGARKLGGRRRYEKIRRRYVIGLRFATQAVRDGAHAESVTPGRFRD